MQLIVWENQCRKEQYIIQVRLVRREDRNLVRAKRGKIKQSTVPSDAYLTEDFARATHQ